jgi:glycosyltransferase involved in cell wall biosynthesis
MKVLVLTNMYPGKSDPWTGSFVAEQVADLADLGLHVSVCAFDGRLEKKEYFWAALRLRRSVRENDFNLVHAHYGLTGAIAITQRRVPVVTTFHGSDTVVPWQRTVSWNVARLTVPIFVSIEGRDRLHCPQATVIPCGVDRGRFQPRNRDDLRAKLGWNLAAPYIVFPGSRRNSVKRVDLFDATIAEVRRVYPDVRSVALEGLSRDEVSMTFAAANVTLMTSDREGSPVTVKESLACETPVVSVRVGDVADVIAQLPGCGVYDRDPRMLAEGVLEALVKGHDPALRQRAEEFSRPRIAQRVAEVYERVVAEHPRRRR